MKFYYDLLCPPSRAVLVFCNILKIPIEEIPVALRKSEYMSCRQRKYQNQLSIVSDEHLTEEFKKNVGKLQRLPILHHNGFSLGESVAIFRYLTKDQKIGDPWYPSNVQQRARVDEYLSWTHNNIRFATGMYIYAKWRDPLVTGQKTDEAKVRTLEKRLDNALDEMNDTWLEKDFITGDQMTVADIFAACDLEQISEISPKVED